jgi:hypothetical protein
MIACSQLKSIRIVGPPANPESTKNFGTALALSLRLGPGTALALSLRLGPGTALALSMRLGPGTALALSMREAFGTALALSANAGEAAQTNAIVPKRSVLYEVITAPITAKKQEAARALFNIVQVQGAADSCHRYQHFAYLGGGSYS